MNLNGTMLCAAGAAYNIHGATYSPQNDQLYEPQLKWTVEPVAFTGGTGNIDACYVGQNATGIIVSARGTLYTGDHYIDDWLNDLWSEPASWSYPFINGTLLPGNVHAGFYDAVKNVYAGVQSQVQSLLKASPAPIYITGHSKGGGMAALLAYLLNLNGIAVEKVVTFAAPKPGDTGFQTAYELAFPNMPTPKHIRFENYGDLVPFLWPASSVANPILKELVSYMNSWGPPWTTFASDIALAENWDYQPVGSELYIAWNFIDGKQSIVTNPTTQGADLIANLAGQLAEFHSPEYIIFLAHTIGACLSGSTKPVVGYLSEVCPGIGPSQCSGTELDPAARSSKLKF